jgi:hypothetical protein
LLGSEVGDIVPYLSLRNLKVSEVAFDLLEFSLDGD